jgi:hypothetical protein
MTASQRRDTFLEFARSNERAVKKILNENQMRRLEQIRLQLQGFLAFNEPTVVSALKLADSQREALRQIEGETFMLAKERSDLSDESARRELRKQLLNSAMEKSLAVLRAEQQERWRKLISRPFQGRLSNDLPGIPPQH